jgi:hypothetical protein
VYTGPAGGLVFYDKGSYGDDGWRYLEAAPYRWFNGSTDPKMQWGAITYTVDPSAKATAVGTGEADTANIVSYHDRLWTLYPGKGDYYTNPTGYYSFCDGTVAAKECSEYSVENGGTTYDDWFLPSKDELDLIYEYLKVPGLGGFSTSFYWSSSEEHNNNAWAQYFYSGGQGGHNKDNDSRVRPVRAF